MKKTIGFILLSCLSSSLMAQDVLLPYANGNVNQFLKENRAAQQPSVVLYNFDLESG